MLRFPRAFLAGASGSTYGLLVVVVAAGLTFRVVPALAESGVPGFANACDAPPVVACEGKSELVTCEGCGFTTCACLAHGCSLDGGERRAANVCFAIERCDATTRFPECAGKREGEACEGAATPSRCVPSFMNCLEGLSDGRWEKLRPMLECQPGAPYTPDAGRDAGAAGTGSDAGAAPEPASDDGCAVSGGGAGVAGVGAFVVPGLVALAWAARRSKRRRR